MRPRIWMVCVNLFDDVIVTYTYTGYFTLKPGTQHWQALSPDALVAGIDIGDT